MRHLALSLPLLLGVACDQPRSIAVVPLALDQEDRNEDGSLYTPNTQTFMRGHHWLDKVPQIELFADRAERGRLVMEADGEHLSVENIALDQLVPRLHYPPASPPDEFDAMNLLLAEYSRNGLTFANGSPGDTGPHFETSLTHEIPWTLTGPYQFKPDGLVRPLRISVINNCLNPGLWELSANDRAGEIYHSWFNFPADAYTSLVARVNGLEPEFVASALQWRTEAVAAHLERLRTVKTELGETPVSLAPDGPIGFSSQGSRRKIGKRFAQVGTTELRTPTSRMELVTEPVHLVNFVPPGKYALNDRRVFDLRFLGTPQRATVREVTPLTRYRWLEQAEPGASRSVEIEIDLGTVRLVIGNLPLALLVPEEDYVMNGFGVGVLEDGTPAERRSMLLDQSPAPSFAYLLDADGAQIFNSHERGVEQIFIRSHAHEPTPYWEITVTSFERVIDLVRYRVEIPAPLRDVAREAADQYISPIYFTYTDDNIR